MVVCLNSIDNLVVWLGNVDTSMVSRQLAALVPERVLWRNFSRQRFANHTLQLKPARYTTMFQKKMAGIALPKPKKGGGRLESCDLLGPSPLRIDQVLACLKRGRDGFGAGAADLGASWRDTIWWRMALGRWARVVPLGDSWRLVTTRPRMLVLIRGLPQALELIGGVKVGPKNHQLLTLPETNIYRTWKW